MDDDFLLRAQHLSAAMTAWAQREDRLAGAVAAPVAGDDVVASFASSSGTAIGVARVAHTAPSSSLSLWGATTTDQLQLRFEPGATGAEIAEVLDAWLARPATPIAEPGGDHARVLRLPVVARAATLPLIERGFVPATATVARPVRAADADTAAADTAAAAPGALLRPPDASDRDRMRELMVELIRTEAPFGAVRERAPGLCDVYVEEALRRGPGWTVVAEVDGEAVGWASLAPSEESSWAAPSVAVAPVVYLGIATVTASRRSAGAGRALATALHAQAARAEAAAVVLDASVLNPWSVPFWYRQGYRPLWTTWHRRLPAAWGS